MGITTALAKADFQLGLNDTLAIRYNGGFTYNGDSGNFGGLTAFSNTGVQRLRENSFALSNTYTSTTFINESRFFYSRREQNIDQTDNKVRVRLFAPEGTVDFGRNLDLPLERQEDIYQFVDNILVTRGRHNVKTGIDFAYTKLSDVQFSNKSGGVYSFQPLNFADLLAQPGLPSFTTLQVFDPQLVRSPEQIAFLQLLAQRLPTIIPNFPILDLANLALPTFYEQSFGRSTAISGNLQSLSLFIQDDFKLKPNLLIKAGLRYDINRIKFAPNNNGNFSPRLAIAYHPQKLPHLNLRAAYGLFFGIPSVGSILNARIDSQTTTSVLLFPFSILPTILPMSRFPESNQPPTNIPNTPQLSEQFIVDNKLRNSYAQQISTGIDYSFNNRTSLSLTYNFVKGIKLLATRNINPEVPPSGFFDLIPNRNDPTKGDVQELESAFNSAYHAFTILFNTQFNNRFSLLAHYTFSKSIDNVVDILPNFQEIANPLRPGEEKALSLQDLRNRLVVSGTWQLDYRKNRLLKDFQLSTIISLNSGRPYNLLAGADLDENRINADRPLTLGRNVGITPGFANVDLRLSRTLSINEKIKLEVIVEAFNLFNHVNINPNEINRVFLLDQQGNFNLPKKEGSRFSLPAERYKGAFAPRQFQIGFRLNF